MSYARFSEGDVYVFGDTDNLLECQGCKLNVPSDSEFHGMFLTPSRSAMILHLKEHVAAGHKVPDSAFTTLAEELRKFGDTIRDDEDD